MGTTSEKLIYLNNTKIAIKNELNKFGADIEDSDSFRSYVDSLETIYSEYPTVNGTGITVVLNDTKKAPLKSIALNSTELTQDGTPSSSSPVDVNAIKGENNVNVGNKNLFDYHWFGTSKEVQWEYYTGSDFRAIPIYIGVGNSATFSSNVPQTSPSLLYAIEDITVSPPSGRTVNSSNSRTIQANTNGYVYLAFVNTRQYYEDVANGTYYIQIEIGQTATEYVEHQEQNYPISLASKNLFNLTANDFNNGQTLGAGKKVTLTLKPNTNYTLSSNAPGSSSETNIWFNGTSSAYNGVFNGTSKTFSTDSNGNIYIMIRTTMISNIFRNYWIQLEEDTATEYEPYHEPIEYCKIGDYADQFFKNTIDSEFYDSTLELNEWYLKKNINKTIITDDNKNTIAGYNANNYGHPSVQINKSVLGYESNFKSNVFLIDKYKQVTSTANVVSGSFSGNFTAYILMIWNDNFTDLETARNLLVGTIIYNPLATPQYIHISQEEYPTLKAQLDNLYNNAKSYNGQTNITQTNDDLPFNIELSVLMKGDK